MSNLVKCAFCKYCILNSNSKYMYISADTEYGIVELNGSCEEFKRISNVPII